MATVATLRVQSLHVTRERYETLSATVEKQCLSGFRETPSMREHEMLAYSLAKLDPNGWTYLPQWALSPLQQRRKLVAAS